MMKIGLVSVKENLEFRKYYKLIEGTFKDNNVEVDLSYYNTAVSEDENALVKTYQRNKKLVQNNDCLVAEISDYSLGVGYLIADAENHHKPVLALFNKNRGKFNAPIIKASTESKLVFYREYDEKNLDSIIKDFIAAVNRISETKYILLLPPEIDQYLDWASFHYHMPKSQIVREAISAKMKANKDWKTYQETQSVK